MNQKETDFDSMVVASDVLAQGAFDALALATENSIRYVSAMVNSESRIQSSVPYTAVIADGYAVGQAVVELLQAHITAPHTAPRQRILRGDIGVL